tara:strand:+ start:5850 stop:6107 length:258 start_codon:yes stop_codon:yes gene_type:complete
MKEFKLTYSEGTLGGYFSIPEMNTNEAVDLLIEYNIIIGEVIFTLYDINTLRSIITKSKFNSGVDIIYVRDLVQLLGDDGQLRKY